MKRAILHACLATSLVASGIALSQQPVENVDPSKHGNLASAQQLIRQAFDRVSEAQVANKNDLGGHAAKAKELLQQASREIKLAAEATPSR